IDEPLSLQKSGLTGFFEADGLGSVTTLTNSAAAVAETYSYRTFGDIIASSGTLTNPFQYTAREFDSETGLLYLRTRYYDSGSGRLLSQDPIDFQGGINFYTYVTNSSTRLGDPLGLQGVEGAENQYGPAAPLNPYPIPPGLPPIPGLDGNVQVLLNLFSVSQKAPSGTSMVARMDCAKVRQILHAQGYLGVEDWGTSYVNPFLAWDPFAHAGGWEYRSRGPGFHFRVKYQSNGCHQNCTLDQFHIDRHNPIDHPWDHLLHDFFQIPE